MDQRIAHEQQLGAMRSSVAWALLGLVIERPSYGYELAQRFRRIYGETLVLSGHQRIYIALDALRVRSLIEEVAGVVPEASARRRPRPRYRATPEGMGAYQDWLFNQMEEQRQRSRLFARQLAMLEPHAALEVLDQYEHECLVDNEEPQEATTERQSVAARLAEEEEQLGMQVRLSWIEFARSELKLLLSRSAEEGEPR